MMNKIQSFQFKNTDGVSKSFYRILSVALFLFIVLSSLAFKNNPLYLFYDLDGHYMMNLAKEEHIWRGLELGLSHNFLQALGEVWFPLNTLFFPGYILSTLNSSYLVNPVTAYVTFSLEFFIIAFVISRFAGFNRKTALVSAWVLPLLAFPYYNQPVLYNILPLVPHFGTMIVIVNLIWLAFFELGKRGFVNTLLLSIVILLQVLYLVFAYPAMITICAPLLSLMCAIYLVLCPSLREKKIKLICSALLFSFLLFSGTLHYVYGLIKFTAVYYFPKDLLNDRMNWGFVSILAHGRGGTALFVLGILGAVFFGSFGQKSQKLIAQGLLITASLILALGGITVHYDVWHGPSPLYFELFLWPFYVAYAVAFSELVLSAFFKLLNTNNYIKAGTDSLAIFLQPFFIFLFITLAFAVIIFLPKAHEPRETHLVTPIKTSIVTLLQQEISLTPGSEFHGRVANFTGRTLAKPISWMDLFSNDFLIGQESGNDHRLNGLWSYNIPTLDIYNPLITPSYFQFSKFFFSRPGDKQLRNIMALRNPDLRWLKALGVRYVITDAPLTNAVLRIKLPLDKAGSLYLYELPSFNYGQLSPTHVTALTQTQDILKALKNETFEPSNEVILNSPLSDKLSTASQVKIYVEKGFIRVTAASKGLALIVLPLEYSNCLTIVSKPEQAKVKLLKANLIQTAVLFNKKLDVSIRYFTGPFQNSGCRLDDAKEFETSQIKQTDKLAI